jgi:hypothetical protein
MALIDGGSPWGERRSSFGDSDQPYWMDAGYQRWLARLEVDGEPEPFQVREEFELVDGPPPSPKPKLTPKPRKRRTVKPEEQASDRDSVNLARFARKLKGQE